MKTLAAPLSKGDGELRDLVDKRDAKRRALARTWHMMETKAKHPTMAQDQRPSKAPSHPSWLTPLVNLARGIFVAQVQLERREGKLHVVLQDSKIAASTARPNSPTPDKPSVPSSPPVLGVNEAQLQRMQAAMAQVLNQHIGARKVLKHLSYLEHALKRQGAQCFLDLPVEVLKSTLLQLASVMGPTPSQGLTEVHACLVVIVVDRDVDVSSGESSGRLSEFNVANKVQVCEISHSDFAKADPQWPLEEEVAC